MFELVVGQQDGQAQGVVLADGVERLATQAGNFEDAIVTGVPLAGQPQLDTVRLEPLA